MPGLGGAGATRRLKAMSPAPVVHIVSMYDDEVARDRAAAAGADGFISKAAFGDLALAAIDAWFAGSGNGDDRGDA